MFEGLSLKAKFPRREGSISMWWWRVVVVMSILNHVFNNLGQSGSQTPSCEGVELRGKIKIQ